MDTLIKQAREDKEKLQELYTKREAVKTALNLETRKVENAFWDWFKGSKNSAGDAVVQVIKKQIFLAVI